MDTFASSPDDEATLYQLVLNDIANGHITGGQRLKVVELAKRYGVSMSPVREVLRRMQGEGYVDISHNRGATVRKADAGTIRDIFEILQLLEPYFITWFADYAQPETLDEMAELQAKIAANPLSDLVTFRQLDAEFHRAICKNHYNERAAELWKNLRQSLIVYGASLRISPSRYAAIQQEHENLLDAFRANDVEQADKVIRQHLAGSFTQMSQQMSALAP
ncbi:MAG: GntR family transcriptional regulator [Geminicoccaceae bacterium]